MLKRIRKQLKKNNGKVLTAVISTALAVVVQVSTAYAALPAQDFYDGIAHIISDNITTSSIRALYIYNPGTSASMNGFTITSSGLHGVQADAGGAIQLTDVIILHSGNHALVSASIGSMIGSITMDGGSITTTRVTSTAGIIPSACAVLAYNGGTILLRNVSIQAAGTALYADSNGNLTASVDGQNISGGTVLLNAAQAGVINLTASNGSQLYGIATMANPANATANLTLNSSAVWTMPDNSALTNLALSGGIVTFTAPSGGYKTLTVNGGLSGSGGTFNLNANLAAALADCLTVSGTASGSHTINITNQGGLYNGPQVVKVVNLNEAQTNTATFIGGDIGPYRYHLTAGSQVPGGYSGVDSLTDYYLYGNLNADQALAPSNAANAAIGTSAATNVLWYGEMNEIRKRMGELRMGTESGGDFWVRTYADIFKVRPTTGQSFDLIARGIELGCDNPQSFRGGKKYTGFLVGSGKADNSFAENGTGNIDSFYVGSYGSWLRDDGSYFDLIGKYNWFRHSFSAPVLGGGSDSGNYRNNGFGLSAEIGKRIERGKGIFIEPAAELSALWMGRASYFTTSQMNVEVPSARSLQLRLGCTVGKKTVDSGGAARQLYGKFSWVNEYAGESSINADAATFDSSIKGHQWVGGIGFVEDNGKQQYYIDIEKSWGNPTSKPWGVNAGYRWKF